jgi:PKD repeat protein
MLRLVAAATTPPVETLENRRLLSEVGFRAADYAAGPGPVQAAVGDFNRDGADDVAVGFNGSNAVGIYLNSGDGGLRPYTPVAAGAANPVGVVAADFDGDGATDLAVGFNSAPQVSVLRSRGDGTFEPPRAYATDGGATSIAVGDVSGDGRPDIVTANWSASNLSVLLQLPDGTFNSSVPVPLTNPPTGVALSDLDADGKLDLVVVRYGAAVDVRWGNGNGTFGAPVVAMSGNVEGWPGVADSNADGKADLYIATMRTSEALAGVVVVQNNGNRTFAAPLPPAGPNQPNNLVVADFVHDGAPDVITSSSLEGSGGTGYVLTGRSDGSFDRATVTGVAPAMVNVLGAGDVDGNGLTDVVGLVSQGGYKLEVLLSEALPGRGLAFGNSYRPADVEVAEFIDNHRPGSPLEAYSATIDWGGGARSPGRVVAGEGGKFRVVGSHTYERNGTYTVNTTVSNGQGGTSVERGGTGMVTDAPVSIAGHNVFYNQSAFDGRNDSANAADDNAIAPDKSPLLQGAAATFDNVTSYKRGINGVMVDIAGLPLAGLSAGNFLIRSGASPDRSTWQTGPVPASVTIRRDAGVGSSDRVTLTWRDNDPASPAANRAVKNGWLEVTVLADARTGLPQADVFAFGNLTGETGDAVTPMGVSAADLGGVKRNLNTTVGVSNSYDFNRDGKVNALDLGIAKASLNRSLAQPPSIAAAAAFVDSADSTARRSLDDLFR